MNIAELLTGAAGRYAGRPMLRHNGRDVDYREIAGQTDRLTGAFLERGIRSGDRILLLVRNRPEWLVSFFAALRAGALVVPVNPALTQSEVTYIVGHCTPRVIIVDADLLGIVAGLSDGIELVDIAPDGSGLWHKWVAGSAPTTRAAVPEGSDPAVMFYTSGTTGRPKGAVLSHSAEIFTAEMVAEHFRIKPQDISLIASSLSFIYPLMIDCLACIKAGATVVLQERFHPEHTLRAIAAERATIFMGVPTMFAMMLNWGQGRDVEVPSLKLCISAGQNLAWNVAKRFRERFGMPIYDLWGQTEGTPITSYDPANEPQGRPESCGKPLPGCRVRVIDDSGRDVHPGNIGEVLLASPSVMLGYYESPAATAETLRDGWIYTGDLGHVDSDGYLYIVGRKRDLIIRGGANVYPVEIEDVIYAHPAVAECAVIGVPDETFGELVKACVVRKGSLSADELASHCRERLAEYKVPTLIEFIDELPKGPTGKILKRVLRERGSGA